MFLRGIRGATSANENTRAAILDATRELLEAITHANELQPADIASVIFTMTPDLDTAFPAAAARAIGWTQTALLDMSAPRVANDLPRGIRVLIHWNTNRAANEIKHIYLRDARKLRPDWIKETE